MEIWDLYDKDRNLTGKQMHRGEIFEADTFHLVVHVCLFNQHGKMLIQQRQADKEDWKNMWDVTIGGSAITGETSQQAAEREMDEELGYELNLQNKRPSVTVNFKNGFDDYYLIEDDLNISQFPLPTEEVQQVKWASKNEILNMISEGLFIHYHKSLIELLFDMKDSMGAHNEISS